MYESLEALSPLDGRYLSLTQPLRDFFSESALIRARVETELDWLKFLALTLKLPELKNVSEYDLLNFYNRIKNWALKDAAEVKLWEEETQHDVKAVEYWLADQWKNIPGLHDAIPFIHFACTSEDINNLAWMRLCQGACESVIFPVLETLTNILESMAVRDAEVVMLARTHGQLASPTTLGKEWAVFCDRFRRQCQEFKSIKLTAKCNGAVGNFNAHVHSYPHIDWIQASQTFISNLGFEPRVYTTQIESMDRLASMLHAWIRCQQVLVDLARDVWGYASLGVLSIRKKGKEVGSSTMPHKVNPILFENAEGNMGLGVSLSRHLAETLMTSRWQRDLVGSTLLRNMGVALGYGFIGIQQLVRALPSLIPCVDRCLAESEAHFEVLAEALQTELRRHGMADAYVRLQEQTQGRVLDAHAWHEVIGSLSLPEAMKARFIALTPKEYVGLAPTLAKRVHHG